MIETLDRVIYITGQLLELCQEQANLLDMHGIKHDDSKEIEDAFRSLVSNATIRFDL